MAHFLSYLCSYAVTTRQFSAQMRLDAGTRERCLRGSIQWSVVHNDPKGTMMSEHDQEKDNPTGAKSDGAKADTTKTMPGFLTREEYEQIGDEPEPLPKDFQVIDGGAGETGIAQKPDAATDTGASAPAPTETADTEPEHADPAPTGAAAAANAVGSFFSEGVASVREMNAARRAHAEAREALEQLDRRIEEQTAELEHRRDIENRFGAIIEEETARQDAAVSSKAAAETKAAELQQQADAIRTKLDNMKEEDGTTEKRLRAALEAAEAKEESSRESGSRLQRRLDDARNNLEKAESERTEGVAAAQRAIESAKAHLTALNAELAEVQRNPSANSAEYSVRSADLQNQISDAAADLRLAQEDLPRVDAETQAAITAAHAAVATAEKPIGAAKKAYAADSAEADRAREAFDTAKKDADARQKELRRQISDTEKAIKEQERAAQDAQDEADAAQTALDEANDIHAHPEVTEALERAIAADQAEREHRAVKVEELASAERDVRERTRGSRTKFLGFIALVVAFIVCALILSFAMPK